MTIRHGIFEVRPETHPGTDYERDRDVADVLDTLDACAFPWWRVISQLTYNSRLTVDRYPFPITWKDPRDVSGDVSGYVSNRRMWLRPGCGVQTIAHELGHVADLGTLGDAGDKPTWNDNDSASRKQLLDLADHHDSQNHPHRWNAGGLTDMPWEARPIEAVTVPWTRLFFDDERFHYPQSRFSWRGHTWDDLDAVRAVFDGRAGDLMPFTDIDDSVHKDAILWAAERGLVDGFEDGSFRPGDPVSRGQLASVLKAYDERV